VKGTVKQVQQPRSFTTRNGTTSWVRNVLIHDADDELKIVIWGETALIPVSPGDQVELYHATAKPGRFGGSSWVWKGKRIPDARGDGPPFVFSGTIIAGRAAFSSTTARNGTFIEGTFTHGSEVIVTGHLRGSRIIPEQVEPVVPDARSVLQSVLQFRDELES